MSRLLRLFKILRVFSRYRLDTFIALERLPAAPRLMLKLAPWRALPEGQRSRGASTPEPAGL